MGNVQRPPLDTGAIAATLQASILDSTDVNGFLVEVVSNAAKTIAHQGDPASCGITIITRDR